MIAELFDKVEIEDGVAPEFPLDIDCRQPGKPSYATIPVSRNFHLTEKSAVTMLIDVAFSAGFIYEAEDDEDLSSFVKSTHRRKAGLESTIRYAPEIVVIDSKIKNIPLLPENTKLIVIDTSSDVAYKNLDISDKYGFMILIDKSRAGMVHPVGTNVEGVGVLNPEAVTFFRVEL